MLIKHQIRKKRGKLLAIGVAMGLMSCTITGCSAIIQQEEVVLDIPEYKESDLPDGVFLKVDDTFYAPYNEGKTYGQTAMNSSPDRVIWYLEGEEKHIPTFKNGYQIVYKNKSELPDQFSLEGFEYVCDSVGIKDIRLDDKGRYTLYAATLKEGSDAETALQDLIGDTSVILDNVDGNPVNSNIITRTGSINGLELGKTYTLGFYIGTEYRECQVKADTQIYVSKSVNTIVHYELTKSGYMILQMPDLMTPGYYDIDNSGVVNYTGILENGDK